MPSLSPASNGNDRLKVKSESTESKLGRHKTSQRKSILGSFDLKRRRTKSRQGDQQFRPPESHESITLNSRKSDAETGKGTIDTWVMPSSYDTNSYHRPLLRLTQENSSTANMESIIMSDSEIKANIESSQLLVADLRSAISIAQSRLDLRANSSEGGDSGISDNHYSKKTIVSRLRKNSKRSKARSMPDQKAAESSPSSGREDFQIKRSNSLGKPASKSSSHSSLRTSRSRSRALRSPPPPPPVKEKDGSPPSLPNVDIEQIRNEIIDACVSLRDVNCHHQHRQTYRSDLTVPALRHKSALQADQALTEDIINNVKTKLGLSNKGQSNIPDNTALSFSPVGQHKRSMSNVSSSYPHEVNDFLSSDYPLRQRRRSTTDATSRNVIEQLNQKALNGANTAGQSNDNSDVPTVPAVPRNLPLHEATGKDMGPEASFVIYEFVQGTQFSCGFLLPV
ncbi:hypothetical protein BX666DRAFT_1392713 [Dichotomocladium elegans]|nr:hypothetical protein BX666DRAFT_1392713 [Dichotomocladium elegans]